MVRPFKLPTRLSVASKTFISNPAIKFRIKNANKSIFVAQMSTSTPSPASLDWQAQIQSVRQSIAQHGNDGWDRLWEAGVTPWETGDAQLSLKDLLESGQIDFPKSGHALIPGCGRGFDALLIASKLGLDVLAVDISPLAIDGGKKLITTSGFRGPGRVTFEVRDFFKLGAEDEGERNSFDLIYDYTFFVAIPPALRPAWGEQVTALTKPGGYLITVVFPIVPPHDEGPPFYVHPDHYATVLGERWERVIDEIPKQSIESHKGKERIMVWKRL